MFAPSKAVFLRNWPSVEHNFIQFRARPADVRSTHWQEAWMLVCRRESSNGLRQSTEEKGMGVNRFNVPERSDFNAFYVQN